MYFGSHVGIENELKIYQKRHRKNDAKKKGTKMANNRDGTYLLSLVNQDFLKKTFKNRVWTLFPMPPKTFKKPSRDR